MALPKIQSISTDIDIDEITEKINELEKMNQIQSEQIRSLRNQLVHSTKTIDITNIEKRREETIRQYLNDEYKKDKSSIIFSLVYKILAIIGGITGIISIFLSFKKP
jgi:hypothetical protein